LSSLDATRAGGHGLDLSLTASYLADQAEDKDVAGVNHRLRTRLGEGQVYAPGDGLTDWGPRFKDDIAALRQLTAFEIPPLWGGRQSQVVQVFYGFGDASGKQFRTTISKNYNCKCQIGKGAKGVNGVRYRIGLWTAEEEEESSNFEELKKLLDTVKEEAESGRLKNCKFFLFTNNSKAESCFYRGTQSRDCCTDSS
jgi:hypothetical protein